MIYLLISIKLKSTIIISYIMHIFLLNFLLLIMSTIIHYISLINLFLIIIIVNTSYK